MEIVPFTAVPIKYTLNGKLQVFSVFNLSHEVGYREIAHIRELNKSVPGSCDITSVDTLMFHDLVETRR